MYITDSVIKSVSRIKIPCLDNEENKKVQDFHQYLLNVSKNRNNSNEVGIIISLDNWEHYCLLGSENEISISKDCIARKIIQEAPYGSLIFMHNHPKNTVFSEQDLRSFFSADSIKVASVICNNGRIYLLVKLDNYSMVNAIYKYNCIMKTKPKGGAVKEFLRVCTEVGLQYKYGGNIYGKKNI